MGSSSTPSTMKPTDPEYAELAARVARLEAQVARLSPPDGAIANPLRVPPPVSVPSVAEGPLADPPVLRPVHAPEPGTGDTVPERREIPSAV